MVETIDVDAAGSFKNVAHSTLVATEGVAMGAARTFTESALKTGQEFAGAALGGAVITAGITQWDYANARDNIRRNYEMELSAKSGKPYNEITNKDLDKFGQQNAVIGDALKRAKFKRNVGLVAGTIAVGAALVAGALVVTAVGGALGALTAAGTLPGVFSTIGAYASSVLAGTATGSALASTAAVVGTALTAGAASIASFMGAEKLSESIIHSKFGHKEPSLRKVTHNPALQDQLSLSSQVSFIQHLQKRVDPQKPSTFISQEQVFTAILAAQPGMAEGIKNQYGAKFSALPPEQRKMILSDANKSINIEQITSELNTGQIRAQELAFIMQGETSGVPMREAPVSATMHKEHLSMKQELAEAKQVITQLKHRMKVTDTKLGNIQGATLDMSTNSEPQTITQNTAPVMGPAQQRELARRQAAAAKASAVGA